MDDGCKIRVNGKQHPTSPDDGCVIVDARFYDVLAKHRFYWDVKGYCNICLPQKGLTLLHRYIVEELDDQSLPDGKVVHHKNDKKFDNRICNLEITTHAHNLAAASRKTTASSSRYKGVHIATRTKQWTAMISFDRKTINLGDFALEKEAGRAYDRAYIAIYSSTSGSNQLLDANEVQQIMQNRDEFLPKAKRHDRILPKCITRHGDRFRMRIRGERDKVLFQGVFKTVEEATAFRDSCLEDLRLKEEARIREIPIERNAEGVAIITVKILKSDDIVFALVDDNSYYKLVRMPWTLDSYRYAMSHKGRMHNILMPNDDKKKVVDHINNDRLDNRLENLRIVTYSMNNRNAKRKREGSSSQHPGVSWDSRKNQWQVGISINGKRQHLGLFDNEEEAAQRYREEYQMLELEEHSS
jgi:hypothetical protein